MALRIQLDDARARVDVPELKLVYKLKAAAPTKVPAVPFD
jgi:hypothetical protein